MSVSKRIALIHAFAMLCRSEFLYMGNETIVVDSLGPSALTSALTFRSFPFASSDGASFPFPSLLFLSSDVASFPFSSDGAYFPFVSLRLF
jgi:hypothetical protein